MSEIIRILHLEDDARDAELASMALQSENLRAEIEVVDSGQAFLHALRAGGHDVILADYQLPDYDGARALDAAKDECPDTPFIFVSGKMGEALAVESLQQGAADYVLKRYLMRLPGAVQRALRIAADQREKKAAEKKLRASEAKLLALIDNSQDSIWSVDAQFRLVTFNLAAAMRFRDTLGVTLRAGLPMHEVLPAQTRDLWQRCFNRAMAGESFQLEIPYTEEGAERQSEMSLNPIRNGGEITGAAVFSRDVTERNRTQFEIKAQRDKLEKMNQRLIEHQAFLVQTEKLASLGQLSAGVAHEINNPMSFVTSNLRTLAEYVEQLQAAARAAAALVGRLPSHPDPAVEAERARLEALLQSRKLQNALADGESLVAESLEGARRVNEIVRSLKSVARADDGVREATDVNACLEDALKLAWNQIKHKGEIRKDLGALPLISAYPGPLQQVFLNLLINAAQAIPEKGFIEIRSAVADGKIAVSVTDSGVGIPEKNRSRLFTPFFTTKPTGQGTGLGLSISYGIVQKHHGDIQVASQPGKGTTFTVLLPVDETGPEGRATEEGRHADWHPVSR